MAKRITKKEAEMIQGVIEQQKRTRSRKPVAVLEGKREFVRGDQEMQQAVIDYTRGRKLEAESKRLIENAKNVFKRRIDSRGLTEIYSDFFSVRRIEKHQRRFQQTRFKEENPGVYDMYCDDTSYSQYDVDTQDED